jgi:hypothetical protein
MAFDRSGDLTREIAETARKGPHIAKQDNILDAIILSDSK